MALQTHVGAGSTHMRSRPLMLRLHAMGPRASSVHPTRSTPWDLGYAPSPRQTGGAQAEIATEVHVQVESRWDRPWPVELGNRQREIPEIYSSTRSHMQRHGVLLVEGECPPAGS